MEIIRRDPQPVAWIHATTTPMELGPTLARLHGEVREFLTAAAIEPVGSPLARYARYERDFVELDAGLGIAATGRGSDRVAIAELPGGEIATAVHVGPYTTLSKTYAELTVWLTQQKRQPHGAPWEVYVTGRDAEPDSRRWRTEIYWPVE
jgi:effector-binding domain-containing protein